jgi:hypothetical protein
MIPVDYWHDIDARLETLLLDGAVKLPSLSSFDLELTASNISAEMGSSTFSDSGASHLNFLNQLSIKEYLAPKLLEIARNFFGYNGDLSNQYHVARKVEPGNSKEMYRAHFDSHLFTIVWPIKMPLSADKGYSGELIYFPKTRKPPKSEINNFIGKAYHKRFASKAGLEKFSSLHQKKVDNFGDYEPLLFLGRTTLHTNYPVSEDCPTYRLTLLSHFFAPSPRYGVGNVLRRLRNR